MPSQPTCHRHSQAWTDIVHLRSGRLLLVLVYLTTLTTGCRLQKQNPKFFDAALLGNADPSLPQQLVAEEPQTGSEINVVSDNLSLPAQLDPDAPIEYREISLEEAVRLALENAKVLRDLGGTLVSLPEVEQTIYDPALTYSDVLFGEEAALSAFDATLLGSAFFENNDRAFNNSSIGNGGQLQQDLHNYRIELQKRSATGSQLSVRHLVDYDFNNSAFNQFGTPSGEFQAIIEGEIRQPLLRGGGAQFNRIAGPDGTPGSFNGVLLARARTDITLAEFEAGVRDLITNVENAYWELYFAYRNLDAQKRARDLALETYQSVAAAAGKVERGKAQNIGQALEQYWRFEAEVQNALNGRSSTTSVSASAGGVTTSTSGVHLAERQLRLITGMRINGGALLRPSDAPDVAPVSFDWPTLVTEAVTSRPELRRQRWRIKEAELELIASRNLLLPRLDAIALYRYRGFGNNLLPPDGTQFSSAYDDLVGGDFQEWQLGVELEIPLGFRNAHNAVRNAEHRIARERVILSEQKRDVIFGLTNAASESQRAFAVAQAQFNRYAAAQQQVELLKRTEQEGLTTVDLTLEAQRRVLDTEILYHQATVDYALALRNVYFETGALLAHNGVFLTEGASPVEAYHDAIHLQNHRTKPLDYVHRELVIAQGRADQ